VTLLELTSAYAAVAGQAFPVRPKGLEDEQRPWWQGVLGGTAAGMRSEGTLDEMKDMLGAVVAKGTGRGAALEVPAFGKTGTTQDSRDTWFVGFAQDLVVGVWIGNDDNSPLGSNMAGGGLPAQVWRSFMTQAIGTRPAQTLAPPIAAPAQAPVLNGSITVPVEGTGYQVGVDVGEGGVTVSAQPAPEQPAAAPGDQPPPAPDARGSDSAAPPPEPRGEARPQGDQRNPPEPPRDRPPQDKGRDGGG
jgi:penicillin-binding protein 1A